MDVARKIRVLLNNFIVSISIKASRLHESIKMKILCETQYEEKTMKSSNRQISLYTLEAERERERERERETGRHKDRDRQTETDRHRQKLTETETETDKGRTVLFRNIRRLVKLHIR